MVSRKEHLLQMPMPLRATQEVDPLHAIQPELRQGDAAVVGASDMLGRPMKTWFVEFSATLPGDVDRANLEEHLEAVLIELDSLDGITDADMAIDYDEPRVMFSMYVQAEDDSSAIAQVGTAMRTAIHAAGGGTPGWEKMLARMPSHRRYEIRAEDDVLI